MMNCVFWSTEILNKLNFQLNTNQKVVVCEVIGMYWVTDSDCVRFAGEQEQQPVLQSEREDDAAW